MNSILLVLIGGSLGALFRANLSKVLNKIHKDFPVGTFLINVLGTIILAILVRQGINDSLYKFLGTGLLGGFTTFSTFNYEVIGLLVEGKNKTAILYSASSYFLCIGVATIIIAI